MVAADLCEIWNVSTGYNTREDSSLNPLVAVLDCPQTTTWELKTTPSGKQDQHHSKNQLSTTLQATMSQFYDCDSNSCLKCICLYRRRKFFPRIPLPGK